MKRPGLRIIVLVGILFITAAGGLWITFAGWPQIVIRDREYRELIASYKRAQPRTKPQLGAWEFKVQVPHEYIAPTAKFTSYPHGVANVRYSDEAGDRPLFSRADDTRTLGVRTEGSVV
ncbi:MAG TPA: hypothetical protein VG778_10905, partial [Blastocatellia bacterium]|nr:hypothetical protein [Blastocatellia bacterium]